MLSVAQRLVGDYRPIADELQELSAAMDAEAGYANAAQKKDMLLGIHSFKFQYMHLLILLLKNDMTNAALRIASAREALPLLPEMVSNWG